MADRRHDDPEPRRFSTRAVRAAHRLPAVELAGGRAAGEAFIDRMTIPARTASLGSVFTIVAHPPSTTHRQLSDGDLAASGITAERLRASIGLEDADEMIADFERALDAARAATDWGTGPAAERVEPATAEPTPA